MKDSQNSNDKLNELSPIKSMGQLLASFLVAECIIEIRGERETKIKKMAIDSLPKLQIKDSRAEALYKRYAQAVNFTPTFVYLCKIGLEDMKRYNFKKDPSVVTSVSNDTSHLQEAFGSTYAALANIDLEEHTLNVFENGIAAGEKKGRIMQTALPMLACLFHDFGKSSELRNELLGENIGRGYRAHAEVSEIYIREILAAKYHTKFEEQSIETIEKLANIVKNHHPANKKLRSDTMIAFVINSDIMARKEEIRLLKQKMK